MPIEINGEMRHPYWHFGEIITKHRGVMGFTSPIVWYWQDNRTGSKSLNSYQWGFDILYYVKFKNIYGYQYGTFKMVGNPETPPYWNTDIYESATHDQLLTYSRSRCHEWFAEMWELRIETDNIWNILPPEWER